MPRPKKNDYSQLTIAQLKTEIESTTQKLKDLLAILNSLSGVRQEALNTLGSSTFGNGQPFSVSNGMYSYPNNSENSLIRMPGAPANLPSLQPIPQTAIDDMFDSDLAISPLDPTANLTEAEFKGFEPPRPEAV